MGAARRISDRCGRPHGPRPLRQLRRRSAPGRRAGGRVGGLARRLAARPPAPPLAHPRGRGRGPRAWIRPQAASTSVVPRARREGDGVDLRPSRAAQCVLQLQQARRRGARVPRQLLWRDDRWHQRRRGVGRILVSWRLDSRKTVEAAAGRPHNPAADDLQRWKIDSLLSLGPGGEPLPGSSSARVVMCQTPEDIVALRRGDPRLARAWRIAMRSALSSAFDAGYAITGVTRTGWYVLERG